MTQVLILGGGGMVGQKLAHRLNDTGLGHGDRPELTLFDMAFPKAGAAGKEITGSVNDPGVFDRLLAARPDLIYHLATIPSGGAEADFDAGWSVNATAFWEFLSALKTAHEASGGSYRPRVIFTSSIAVFGPPYPDRIGDTFLMAPQTSYGAQKAVSELMLADFSRKGFIDGMALRLPTICVRPGKPNLAASSFFSGIIREPLNGQPAVLPVSDSVRHWHASPRSAARFLTHAAGIDTARLNGRLALNLPGVSCTVAEQIEALRNVAGQGAVDLIRYEPDATIAEIVQGWPRDFDPARARALGFEADADFDEIIRIYIEDDLNRR